MLHSDPHAVASSPLTCAASLACYWEGEVVWRTVQGSVVTITFLGCRCFTYEQVVGHAEEDHMCSALVHMCGEVWVYLQ
jgi:hypothetical protein